MDNVMAPVSPGELLDKITILEIKSERIADAEKLKNVRYELQLLTDLWQRSIPDVDLSAERAELKSVNEALWVIEDDIRDEEAAKNFGEKFVELARSVYFTNDKRAAVKKQVNLKLGSAIVEEKSYADYA